MRSLPTRPRRLYLRLSQTGSLLLTLTLTLPALLPRPTAAETLSEVVARVIEEHPRAQAARAAVDAERAGARVFRGALLPQVGVDGSFGPNYRDRDSETGAESGDWRTQADIGGSIRQRLYDFGLTLNESRAAARRADSRALLEVDIQQSLALSTALVYLELLNGRRQVDLAEENIAVHLDTLDKTKQRLDAGRASTADLALVEGRLGLARASLENRRASLEDVEARYRELVGEDPPRNLVAPSRPGQLPSNRDSANLQDNWTVRAAALNAEAAKLDHRASKGLTLPRFDLQVRGSVAQDRGGFEGRDDELSALVVGGWDLWAGGSNRARQQERFSRAREAAALQHDAERVAEAQFDRAIANRKGTARAATQLEIYADEIHEVVAAYEQQVELGNRAILNLLDVKNEDYRARASLEDTLSQLHASEYQVLATNGTLLSHLLPD